MRYVIDAFIVISLFFAFAGVMGMLRMPDVFCRMQSSTNVSTLGVLGVIIFMWELIKANWDVAKRALNPKLPVNPGIVKVPVNLKSEYGLSTLANSITLTPGTITMDVVDQNKQTYFYIHWIDVATEDPVEAGDAIKGTLEKWIGRIWK